MTRKEALFDYNKTGVDNKINAIFDYFEKQSCSSCLYLERNTKRCNNRYVTIEKLYIDEPFIFGCKMWISK